MKTTDTPTLHVNEPNWFGSLHMLFICKCADPEIFSGGGGGSDGSFLAILLCNLK